MQIVQKQGKGETYVLPQAELRKILEKGARENVLPGTHSVKGVIAFIRRVINGEEDKAQFPWTTDPILDAD